MISVPSFSADYQSGLDAYHRGDYQAALEEWRPLAEQNNARAQTKLGWMYDFGRGVAQSHITAVMWYRLAADQGDAEGQFLLADKYSLGHGFPGLDYIEGYATYMSEAIKLYRSAADQGHEGAAEMLSVITSDFNDVVARRADLQRQLATQDPESKESFNAIRTEYEHLKKIEQGYSQAFGSQLDVPSEGVKIESILPGKVRLISQDSQRPVLNIVRKYSKDATGFIEGRVTDNVGVVELLVNGQPIAFGNDGRFAHQEYLPTGGKEFTIVAIDRAGLKATETIRLNRDAPKQIAKVSFDSLNPTTGRVKSNSDAIALIVGVAEYEKTAGAEFADRDAQVFYDYAHLKLGIPQNRIQTLVNDKADEVGLLTGVTKWLKRSVKQGESDVYIFFAGHGLASDDGDTAYLIPYDGAPDFLERTAISRDEVFREVSSVNPRSVTVFLDTCYSGDTRGESRLIAGRPLGIKLQEQSLPAGFTVLTAAGGDQIAKPLAEAQHGMFSYFLMKGMEGGADADGNNEITARELHSYVRENVVQQSGGSQVPELQGDGEKVLVRFR